MSAPESRSIDEEAARRIRSIHHIFEDPDHYGFRIYNLIAPPATELFDTIYSNYLAVYTSPHKEDFKMSTFHMSTTNGLRHHAVSPTQFLSIVEGVDYPQAADLLKFDREIAIAQLEQITRTDGEDIPVAFLTLGNAYSADQWGVQDDPLLQMGALSSFPVEKAFSLLKLKLEKVTGVLDRHAE